MMNSVKMVLNEELNGVEIYFDNKPAKNILDTLKANSFRWSGFKSCWYAKQKENTLKLAQELTGAEQQEEIKTEETKTRATKKQNIKINLWDATRFVEMAVNNKLGTKEIAAEVRKHVRGRFPMVKFSVTSDYNSIHFYIVSAPFEKESVYLKAIEEYCTSLLKAYNYCTCYDPYGDYGSSYNFFGAYARIDWQYVQTEQTEEMKKDMQDFDMKLVEFEKAEEERHEQELEEIRKQQVEQNKAYQIRQEQEKKELELINNSIQVKELEETNQYFVVGSKFAHLNKNNTLDEYREEVQKGDFNLENVKITKEVHFTNAEALNYFSNLLLNDFDFLANTGGSFTDDQRFTSMTDFYQMDKEERETIVWNLYGVAIYYNNELQFIVDAQGHSYARYVGLVDGVTIQKELNVTQFIDKKQLEEFKNTAESLEDISVSVITDNNLLGTWYSDSWNEYKELMKAQLKSNKIKLSKEVIRLLSEESEKLKSAMYKLLTEVDGIQEQFKEANLQQGQKVTLFYISDFGSVITSRITIDKVEYCKYAQYENNVKLTFKPEKKRSLYYNNYHRDLLLFNGWLNLPETVLNNVEQSGVFTVTKSKYMSCDKKQYDEILNYFGQQGIKPIINTYKPTF